MNGRGAENKQCTCNRAKPNIGQGDGKTREGKAIYITFNFHVKLWGTGGKVTLE